MARTPIPDRGPCRDGASGGDAGVAAGAAGGAPAGSGERGVVEPERYGALAGAPGRWLRPDSLERQQAKAELIQLSHAVEDYGRALEAERRRVIQEHQAAQKRAQIGVPAPTPMLQAVLDAPDDQR